MKRAILIYRCASVPWASVELTRPGEQVHEAITRLLDRYGDDLVAVRPLLQLRRAEEEVSNSPTGRNEE